MPTTLQKIRMSQRDRAAHVARTTTSRIGVGGFGFWCRPSAARERIAQQIAAQFGGRVVYEAIQSGCDYYDQPCWIEVTVSALAEASASYSAALAAAGIDRD